MFRPGDLVKPYNNQYAIGAIKNQYDHHCYKIFFELAIVISSSQFNNSGVQNLDVMILNKAIGTSLICKFESRWIKNA